MRAVPLARRNLFQDRRRAMLAVSGVAVALLLVLILDGVFAGALRQVTAYLRSLPADVIVSQRGVRTMHMSASALPETTARDARRVRGVAWAEAIRFTTATVRGPAGRQLSYVIGYDPSTKRGGPRRIVDGRAPRPGQALIDEVAADQFGVSIGGKVEMLGKTFIVSGVFSGGTSITNTVAFIDTRDFAAIRGPTVSYVLIGAEPGVDPDTLTRRLTTRLAGTTAQTRDEFVDHEGRIVRDMSADVMQIMSVIAFLIALAVVALTLFTATLSKLREYAVIKALGASSWRLTRTVLAQATWSTALALGLAVVLAFAVAAAVAALSPNVRLAIEAASVERVAIAALVVGGLGALLPLGRIARLDPATAFRG
jgi:putative ABC transport system permease protein